MADLKITQLDPVSTPADADLFETVQDVATTPVNKKITFTQIKTFLYDYFFTNATAFAVKTSKFFVNVTNGYVGIGTASPTSRLEVLAVGTTSETIAQFLNSNGSVRIKYGLESTGAGSFSLYDNANNKDIYLSTVTSADSYINNGGNFGVGTTTPLAQFHLHGPSPVIRLSDSAFASSTYMEISADNQNTVYINGYTESGQNSTVALNARPADGTSNASVTVFRNTDTTGTKKVSFYRGNNTTTVDGQIGVDGNDTYFNSGNVGVGLTNPTYKLQVNGQPAANGYTLWTNYSDERLKENITDFESGGVSTLEKIGRLRPVTYNYNELTGYDEEIRSRRISGFLAQDIQQVFPDMVGSTKIGETEYLDTNLSDLQLHMVKAINELNNIIKDQKIRIENLEARGLARQ